MSTLPPVITVDGPCGSGKSSLSTAISKKIGWPVLESGVLYRILALATLAYDVSVKEKEILLIIKNLDFNSLYGKRKMMISLNGKHISSKEISSQEVSLRASKIAIFPCVREILLNKQKEFRNFPGLVADGRDMGTVVFTDAILKIFLNACLKSRAHRRRLELQKKGFNVSFTDIVKEMEKIDNYDYNRKLAPLIPAKNALILDSTYMDFQTVFKKIMHYVKKILIL